MTPPQIKALAQQIVIARSAYYNGSPSMTDAAYDGLEDQLRAADPNHPALKSVGAAAPSSGWVKTAHAIPMGSLNKAQYDADAAKQQGNDGHAGLRAWFPKGSVMTTISHKLDGISCFDGDTPVHLANGETMPIREIVEEGLTPQILTWTPEERVVTRQVTDGFDNGDRSNWVELTFENRDENGVVHLGTTIVTEDHKFYVPGEGWVAARDLLGKDIQDLNE